LLHADGHYPVLEGVVDFQAVIFEAFELPLDVPDLLFLIVKNRGVALEQLLVQFLLYP